MKTSNTTHSTSKSLASKRTLSEIEKVKAEIKNLKKKNSLLST